MNKLKMQTATNKTWFSIQLNENSDREEWREKSNNEARHFCPFHLFWWTENISRYMQINI